MMTKPARPAADSVGVPQETPDPIEQVFAEFFEAVDAGDVARVDKLMAAAKEEQAAADTVTGPFAVPFQQLSAGTTKSRQDNVKAFLPFVGKRLPLIGRGDPAAHFRSITELAPHAAPAAETMLRDLASREVVRFRPTILVGPPGSGKSWLARQICQTVGLPFTFFPAGGVSDGTFGGTAAHWSTSGPAAPTQGFVQHGVANWCMVIDEIDKAPLGSHNGSLQDVLLGFVDRDNAKLFRDPCLEAVVDCSTINWVLTANDLNKVSEPLRDRCRIIQMPKPGWQHIGPIVRSILDDIARDQDIDPRWLPDLNGDELQLVRKHWAEGSIRKLRRIIETIVDVRDRHLPSA